MLVRMLRRHLLVSDVADVLSLQVHTRTRHPHSSGHSQSAEPAPPTPSMCLAQVLSRCVDFFIANGQFDKAVGLCITNQKYLRGIELCVAHKVGGWQGNKERRRSDGWVIEALVWRGTASFLYVKS